MLPRSSRSGFTLIELLTVIGLIVLLAGITVPVTRSVQDSMRKTKAASDCQRIENALLAYYTEYGRFPIDPDTALPTQGSNPPNGGFAGEWDARKSSQQTWLFAPQLSVLTGYAVDKNDAECARAVKQFNERGISFLRVENKDKGLCGSDVNFTQRKLGFQDPFLSTKKQGSSDIKVRLVYKVKLDQNGNNEIEHYTRIFAKRTLVWSVGPDGTEYNYASGVNDDIGTFGPVVRLEK
jgi:prepilin-type N-terminal cleavage/methylation domain-containing protein